MSGWQGPLIMKLKIRIVTAALATLTAVTGMAEAGTNVQNLNSAYQSESNAANRYRDFARKADAENLKQAAKLFRAAAASEEIHRKIIERAIVKFGGRVETFKLDGITSGSTADNLRNAIRDETAESGSVYPGFLATAKAGKEKAAIRAFNYTLESDKALAEVFQQALDHINGEVSITCYVCQDCGLLVTQLPKKKCPVCKGRIQNVRE
jgi:rubrerythrin